LANAGTLTHHDDHPVNDTLPITAKQSNNRVQAQSGLLGEGLDLRIWVLS
jgi:hypothetical protein